MDRDRSFANGCCFLKFRRNLRDTNICLFLVKENGVLGRKSKVTFLAILLRHTPKVAKRANLGIVSYRS